MVVPHLEVISTTSKGQSMISQVHRLFWLVNFYRCCSREMHGDWVMLRDTSFGLDSSPWSLIFVCFLKSSEAFTVLTDSVHVALA
jgi:hypothetical protein